METNRIKRRGFMKLTMPFYKASKPPNPFSSPYEYSTTSSTVSSKGYVVSSSIEDHAAVTVINPQPNKSKKVSFISSIPADDAVDLKAANYISCVQERFRLQRLNSERNANHLLPQESG